jgi:hypothetical protein
VWKHFDANATRADFSKLKAMGGNTVRVFLTYGSFMEKPGTINEDGLRKLDEFLRLAEDAGLYVHPTGPDHWEGLPDWACAKTDRYTDEIVLKALEEFWRQISARYRGRNVIFAYDLLNEPEIPRESPSMRPKWAAWVHKKYATRADAAKAWGVAPETINWESPAVPSFDVPDAALPDYQRFREDLGEEWVRRQAQAIHTTDPCALVTVGLIQWSIPYLLAGMWHYSAISPARVAPYVDFLEFHFYPFANGFYEYTKEDEMKNLAYLECLARETSRFNKPVVLAEFGWYGGGKLTINGGIYAAATEEQQAIWCRRVVESSAGWVTGWLNWGFYDSPGATDVSELTGLLTSNGKTKAWGSDFERLAKQLGGKPVPKPHEVNRPVMDWEKLTTSRQAQAEYRDAYLKAFQADKMK